MFPFSKTARRRAALEKEWRQLLSEEAELYKTARKAAPPAWRTTLEQKIPAKAYTGLQASFGKAFEIVLEKGGALIEKSYDKQTLQKQQELRDLAVRNKGARRHLQAVSNHAGSVDFGNLALTTVEGIGLGVLGVGMPDIVLFLGVLFKGAYQAALNYGFDYEAPEEQLLLLQMMEAALSKGEAFGKANATVDAALQQPSLTVPDQRTLQEQTRRTSDAFAVELLVLKFIQGMPVVGIVGGVSNPVYYRRVMNYVQLKYHKRYLLLAARREGVELTR